MTVVQPEDHEIQTAAYYNWQKRERKDGNDADDWKLARRAVFLAKNYGMLTHHPLVQSTKQTLTDGIQLCRFCGKSEPEVTFTKEAHALPELVGNKSIVADYECDSCNAFFGNGIENQLANFLSVSRTVTSVEGKKGIPKYVTRANKSRIEAVPGHVSIEDYAGDRITTVDHENKTIKLGTETPTFVPLAVYKCFTKMALSIMPQSEVPHFQHAIDWIREPDHTVDAAHFSWLSCIHYFIPGPMNPAFGYATLFRRQRADADLPYMLFLVAFSNQAFQIMLPCCPFDNHLIGKKIEIPRIPVGMGLDFDFGVPVDKGIPLGSPTPTRVTLSTEMHVDTMTRVR